MAFLNRQDLLKKVELKIEKVEFPDNTHVFVREMTGRERDRYERWVMANEREDEQGNLTFERSLEDLRAKLAVNTVCDEHGDLLLTEEDITILSTRMPAWKMQLIVNAAHKVNKISREEQEALVKNLKGDQPEDSSSDSVKS